MPYSPLAAAICFIVCHGGPADHFATFSEQLSKDAKKIEIYASGPALKKLHERGIEVTVPFSLDHLSPEEENALADQIAKTCSSASVVMTDVGHPFNIKIQKALALRAPQVLRLAYYDNPEPYVPGGYSTVAAEVMLAAQGVLFANFNLAEVPLFQDLGKEIEFGNRKRIGIGYYPIDQAEKIANRRKTEQQPLRQAFFEKNQIQDTGQKVLVYFGGNNEEYFSKALPAFLSLLQKGMTYSEFPPVVIVIQQHPGAKSKNIDGNIISSVISSWKDQENTPKQLPLIILSDFSSDTAQTLADVALYYQTSMGPQFVLAGIPTIQIGHEPFEDILVRNQLCTSVTTVDEWIHALSALSFPTKKFQQDLFFEGLGIQVNWQSRLENALSTH